MRESGQFFRANRSRNEICSGVIEQLLPRPCWERCQIATLPRCILIFERFILRHYGGPVEESRQLYPRLSPLDICLPTSGLQHVGLVQCAHRQSLHCPWQVFADLE